MSVAQPIVSDAIAQRCSPSSKQQAPITRKFLERLPEDKLTWKPHEKSMTAGQLAFHLALCRVEWFALCRRIPAELDSPVRASRSRPAVQRS